MARITVCAALLCTSHAVVPGDHEPDAERVSYSLDSTSPITAGSTAVGVHISMLDGTRSRF